MAYYIHNSNGDLLKETGEKQYIQTEMELNENSETIGMSLTVTDADHINLPDWTEITAAEYADIMQQKPAIYWQSAQAE